MIEKPGIYDLPEEQYHADPCPEPSLSNSIAVVLDQQSPMHAAEQHPRLNPNFRRGDATPDMEFGTAFHALLLRGKKHRIRVIEADDYKTKKAKAERAEARAAGDTSILSRRYEDAVAMVHAVRRQLAEHQEARDFLTDGKPEQTVIWKEGPVWCRAMIDWLRNGDHLIVPDVKSTGGSARPEDWIRNQLVPMGYDMQAVWYLRGLRAVGRKPANFAFIVAENKRPFAMSVVALDPVRMALAERKVERALRIWQRCITENRWPGYPDRIAWAEPKPWELAQMEEQIERDAA